MSIQEFGWRQGSVLATETSQQLPIPFPQPLADGDFALVISQSCDVVHPSYDLEPTVELLVARAIEDAAKDGNLAFGKNPRKIQFQLDEAEGSQLYEISIHDRLRVPRDILDEAPPSDQITLDPDLVDLLARWVAKRYTRAALPTRSTSDVRSQRKTSESPSNNTEISLPVSSYALTPLRS